MPLRDEEILPTRFGNAIRAFETYPAEIYGADAISIWLRLSSVIPKEYMQQIQDTRSQVDFFVNCCLFSSITTLLAFARLVSRMISMFYNEHQLSHAVITGLGAFGPWLGISVIATYASYQWAIISVPAWGELVMSAFDCYLPALAKQLGFELPQTGLERRSFWTTFSQQLLYRHDRKGELLFYPEKWRQIGEAALAKQSEPSVKGSVDTDAEETKCRNSD